MATGTCSRATPNPKRTEQVAAASVVAAGMAAGAVVLPEMPRIEVVSAMPVDLWATWASEIDLTKDAPEMPWIIRDLQIGPGRATALLAAANFGKTPTAIALAVAIASGKPLLGMNVVRGRVAYFAYEATRVTHGKVIRIARGMNASVENLNLFRMLKPLTDPGAVDALLGLMRQRKYLAIVLDTYTSAIAGIDHNSADFSVVLRMLERVSDETGATFIVLVHAKKDAAGELNDLSGHASAAGAVQVVLGLARPDPADKTLFEVRCLRELDRPFEPFRFRFVDAADDALQLVRIGAMPVTPEVKAAGLVDPLVELVRANQGHLGLSQTAIEALAHERGWTRDPVRAALGIAEGRGDIEATGAGRGRDGKKFMARERGPWNANAVAPPKILRLPDTPLDESMQVLGASLYAASVGVGK